MGAVRSLIIIGLCAALTGLCTATTQAQLGLYGAPEILPVPAAQTSYAATRPDAPPQPYAAPGARGAGPVSESSAALWSPWLRQTSASIPDPALAEQLGPPEPPSLIEPDKFSGARPAANPAANYMPPGSAGLDSGGRLASPLAAPPTSSPPDSMWPADIQPSLISQMLEQVDAGSGGAASPAGPAYPSTGCGAFAEAGGCYAAPLARFSQLAFGSACGGCCPWYASAAWITMGRNEANRVWTSYEAGNEANQIGHTNMAGLKFEHGLEVRVGRRLGCYRQWALEGIYWTLSDFNGYASITHPSGVSTPLTTGHVDFGGWGANLWFDNAAEHRLWRSNEYDNVELNLVRNRLWALDSAPWTLDWLLGVRYFRFEEGLIFASLQSGYVWGADNGLREIYLNEHIENHLVGFQFGFEADCWLFDNLRLFVTPKLGIYNNHISHVFRLYLGDGTIPTTGSSGVPGTYPVRCSTNNVSFLGQLDLGLDWHFAPRWSLRGGYRVIAATGIGLADHQIPPYLVDIPEIAAIDTNGDLVVHGAFAGLTFNF